MLKKFQAFGDGHIKNVGNSLALIFYLQCLAIVPCAFAHFAGDIHVGQKVHLDFNYAVAATGFATTALDIKAEAPRFIAAHFGVGRKRKQFAYRVEHTRISRGIGARCAPYRLLVDVNDFIDVL